MESTVDPNKLRITFGIVAVIAGFTGYMIASALSHGGGRKYQRALSTCRRQLAVHDAASRIMWSNRKYRRVH